MAMRTASPWWFSLVFAGGLLLVFLGERPFGHLDSVRAVCTGAGALIVLAVTALRAWTMTASRGDRRRVERALLTCQIGVLSAVILYVLTTDWGRGLIGLGGLKDEALQRYMVPMAVLWSIVMVVSLVPLLMIETSLGTARRSRFSIADMRASEVAAEALEAFRVREMAASGLTMALAASLLMVTCNIAEQRNVRRDLSYFKTSSPGESTINIASSVSTPIKVLLFFPEVNQVKNEVHGYLQALAAAGGRITVEEHDRLVSAKLALEHRVRTDGTVVFVHGDKWESVQLTVDPEKAQRLSARMELRDFDRQVNTALLKVVRARRKAYMVAGHGELNDENSTWAFETGPAVRQLQNVLEALNYDVADLGMMEGLGNQVPDDADLVLLLAPRTQVSDEEMTALDDYLAGGGKMLIVLDPDTEVGLGRLEQRLGLKFVRTPITDDKNFYPRARTLTDRRIILTNHFSSHASMTTLSRSGPRNAILFLNSGSIENAEVPRETAPRRTFVIRSMPEAFADVNQNFAFDEGTEQRRQYALVAAVEAKAEGSKAGDKTARKAEGDKAAEKAEGEKPAAEGEKPAAEGEKPAAEGEKAPAAGDKPAGEKAPAAGDKPAGDKTAAEKAAGDKPAGDKTAGDKAKAAEREPMRVMVFADADVFLDLHQSQFQILGAMVADSVKWLGGEEHIAGEVESEKDVLIEHTRSEDVLWFYATIVGAPLLVLGLGVWFGWWRRQRVQRRAA
jgi:hypothetical protein